MTKVKAWSVKGIDDEARDIAKKSARKSGVTMGRWLNDLIKKKEDAEAELADRYYEDEAEQELAEEFDERRKRSRGGASGSFRGSGNFKAEQEQPEHRVRAKARVGAKTTDYDEYNEYESYGDEISSQFNQRLDKITQSIEGLEKNKSLEKNDDEQKISKTIESLVDRIENSENQTLKTMDMMKEELSKLNQQVKDDFEMQHGDIYEYELGGVGGRGFETNPGMRRPKGVRGNNLRRAEYGRSYYGQEFSDYADEINEKIALIEKKNNKNFRKLKARLNEVNNSVTTQLPSLVDKIDNKLPDIISDIESQIPELIDNTEDSFATFGERIGNLELAIKRLNEEDKEIFQTFDDTLQSINGNSEGQKEILDQLSQKAEEQEQSFNNKLSQIESQVEEIAIKANDVSAMKGLHGEIEDLKTALFSNKGYEVEFENEEGEAESNYVPSLIELEDRLRDISSKLVDIESDDRLESFVNDSLNGFSRRIDRLSDSLKDEIGVINENVDKELEDMRGKLFENVDRTFNDNTKMLKKYTDDHIVNAISKFSEKSRRENEDITKSISQDLVDRTLTQFASSYRNTVHDISIKNATKLMNERRHLSEGETEQTKLIALTISEDVVHQSNQKLDKNDHFKGLQSNVGMLQNTVSQFENITRALKENNDLSVQRFNEQQSQIHSHMKEMNNKIKDLEKNLKKVAKGRDLDGGDGMFGGAMKAAKELTSKKPMPPQAPNTANNNPAGQPATPQVQAQMPAQNMEGLSQGDALMTAPIPKKKWYKFWKKNKMPELKPLEPAIPEKPKKKGSIFGKIITFLFFSGLLIFIAYGMGFINKDLVNMYSPIKITGSIDKEEPFIDKMIELGKGAYDKITSNNRDQSISGTKIKADEDLPQEKLVNKPVINSVTIPTLEKYEQIPENIGSIKLRSMAKNGDVNAMFEIARRFNSGINTEKDYNAAAHWFYKAASKNMVPAQHILGEFYENGIGLNRDTGHAEYWYKKAASNGNAMAMHNLAVLYAGGLDNAEPDFAKAANWFKRAASYGVKDSQYNLAILYERGLGVKQNLLEAYKWFAIAAKSGDKDASNRETILSRQLDIQMLVDAKKQVESWRPTQLDKNANFYKIPLSFWEDEVSANSLNNSLYSATEVKPKMVDLSNINHKPSQDMIKNVQLLLNKIGYNVGNPDGIAGSKTINAVKRFQSNFGLEQNGIIDEKLYLKLKVAAS